MPRLTPVSLFILTCGVAVIGCGTKPAVHETGSAAGEAALRLSSAGKVPTDEKADRHIARDDGDVVMELDVYQLTIPFGGISRNEKFWNHVDEDHVDLATHELLLKNGVRVGIGPDSEWDYFKKLIDQYGPMARPGAVGPVRKGTLELPMRTGVEFQDIFYLNDRGTLYGRSYHKCDNCLSITYEPVPRQPGDARIGVCALVRGLRKQYEVTLRNEERDIEYKRPEYLYDLRLKQDVPQDHFLILAPSSVSSISSSLGNAFFVRPGLAEPSETVLIFVPKPFRVTGEVKSIPMIQTKPAGQSR
ncbi:MAG: hypothetical protein JWN24_3447 [Phycisphaerales bacterium]|nr:hypothetical protein [Phycisphaerales bacterium]